MQVIETIIPIFLIIALGYIIRNKGFLTDHFVQETNRFVFLFPLPVLVFIGIVRSNVRDVEVSHILSVVLPTIIILCLSLAIGVMLGLRQGRLGSFVQTTFHGNVSYIGLAVLFYMLGEEGFKKGSILIGFLILINNGLAVAVLSWTQHQHKNIMRIFLPVIKTPVIVATFLGIIILYLNLPIPDILMRSMNIIANIALPMALIIIGASITMGTLRKSLITSGTISIIKLIALPACSLLLCWLFGIPLKEMLPGILLLATPTATTSFILAREVGGDADIASGAVTLTTLLSPLTYILWTSMLR